ncbi:MAG TPA: YceI family protein [Polyangiaceae bacterium LLY-WYZ-15_(1-7)]|nr:YceI family protein [Polyangiaceae bacterium LLY-WYZ-15_(1-7)]HJL03086.1 YceI family protein [Polyangiaceae bacterium LLY-WYZ-15_(1-7)]HJL08134.1 YceI family protein [Polyangiaceae bacterium LLY-WYZ-15_(1-7)]HJL25106.1 YceI family protein [Polyangiaceae bacterium LLY-WYZ-15_(1-7)]HJL28695.1 YceI family protein [Polyangiaceae bacterium LLY-WYZ-15_(1-7)]
MPVHDASQAECLVFTYKEGLLSKIAHDLKIRVERFEVTVEDERLEASFEPTSLKVVCARKDGRDAPGTLSAGDKKKIEGNIQKDVLETKRHGTIRFVAKDVQRGDDTARVTGELTLHGTTREIATTAKKEGSRWVAEVTLHQPDFGIKPYSAMLGTLKIQPDITVRLSLPA